MSEIATVILQFFGLIGIGFGATRLMRLPAQGVSGLNLFIYYFAMPAWFFHLVATTPIRDIEHWSFLIATTFATYCAFAIAFSFGALLNRGNVPDATIEGLVGSYANVGYLAPALTVAALGPAAGAATALVFAFDHAMLFTIVPLMMVLGGTMRTNGSTMGRDILRRVLLHPFVLAAFVGLIVSAFGIVLPAPIDGVTSVLAAAAPPVALFAVGASLAQKQFGSVTVEMPALLTVKLAVHPLIVYLLLTWIGGFDRIWLFAAVLMAALPPAANVLALAQKYDAYKEQSVTAILLGSAASVLTVSVLVTLILTGALPTSPFG
ncbi:MAG: AEC family transporter [Bauldia sp.]|nr:AEC family transporter [Bauldia sp.]